MPTQNPIEQERTYPLPESQMDRFMFKINITYPTIEEESLILKRMGHISKEMKLSSVIKAEEIISARSVVDEIYLDEKIEKYILDLVFATRYPERYRLHDLGKLIQYGASPRATIYLSLAAKAYAFIRGREYVTPQDVKSIGPDVLRHRVIISYEAEAEEITSDDIIRKIFAEVEVP
jgi:MoxR-like ATPase